jgi:hypothetical protein
MAKSKKSSGKAPKQSESSAQIVGISCTATVQAARDFITAQSTVQVAANVSISLSDAEAFEAARAQVAELARNAAMAGFKEDDSKMAQHVRQLLKKDMAKWDGAEDEEPEGDEESDEDEEEDEKPAKPKKGAKGKARKGKKADDDDEEEDEDDDDTDDEKEEDDDTDDEDEDDEEDDEEDEE